MTSQNSSNVPDVRNWCDLSALPCIPWFSAASVPEPAKQRRRQQRATIVFIRDSKRFLCNHAARSSRVSFPPFCIPVASRHKQQANHALRLRVALRVPRLRPCHPFPVFRSTTTTCCTQSSSSLVTCHSFSALYRYHLRLHLPRPSSHSRLNS